MFSAQQRRTISDAVQKILDALCEPDPRATPDEFRREQFEKQILSLTQRIYKAEAIIVDYNKRLNEAELVVTAHEKRLTPLESLHTRIDSLETAIRQLGSPLVDGDG